MLNLKKFLICLIILVIIAPVIFALSYKFYTEKYSDRKVITFWTLQLGTFDEYINNIILEYEKKHPDIKIKWIDIPYSEGEKRTLAAILTDNPPDIVNLTPDFSLLLAQKKALYTIPKEQLNQFLPAIADSLKYNDEYFGIPFYATSAVTLYNKELIKKIKLKNLPSSYNDLFEISLPENGNFYLTMINFAENDTLLKLLNKYNINSQETINNEKSIYLFRCFKNLYDKGLIPKESITQTHRDALEKYMSGQIAFLVTGANFINMIKENAPSVYKNTEVLPQLAGDTNAYDYSLMNFIIPKKAKYPDIAIDFALFLTNKQYQLDFAKMTTILPVNKEALADDYFVNSEDLNIQSKSRVISASQLNTLQKPIQNVKNKKDLNTLSANYVQQILIKNKDIKESLDDFAKDWKNL